MSEFKSEFMRTLFERGFIHQVSDDTALDEYLSSESGCCYIGFDATAASLHAGSLVQIMLLYWFQQTGHQPIVLMGGGTTLVGDPSGKDESRKILAAETIEQNKAGIRGIFSKFLEFGDDKAQMVDNADWLLKLNYIEFLRDYGKFFSVNQMLARENVRLRLEREQHLSFLEFNYMLLQAYDFVELNKRYGCRLQMGGSDQWGNIVSGVDLGRRAGTAELFALTTPLLTSSSGAKMGKTADGAVWLDEQLLSAYDYWQYWRNSEDADVGRFLKLFTTLPLDEIARLEALRGAELNEAKKVLATEATAMVHGRKQAEKAAETARQAFEEGVSSQSLPAVEIPESNLESGIGLLTVIVGAGFATSNGEARRLVKGGAIRINDQPVNDERMNICTQMRDGDGNIKLSMGKKKHVLVRGQ